MPSFKALTPKSQKKFKVYIGNKKKKKKTSYLGIHHTHVLY